MHYPLWNEMLLKQQQPCLGLPNSVWQAPVHWQNDFVLMFSSFLYLYLVLFLPYSPGDVLQLPAHAGAHLILHILAQRPDQGQQVLLHSTTKQQKRTNSNSNLNTRGIDCTTVWCFICTRYTVCVCICADVHMYICNLWLLQNQNEVAFNALYKMLLNGPVRTV